jgi:hypothetical protein
MSPETGTFLLALLQIIWINILLSGDNAVVFKAVYAKRLDSGEVIVVNGATTPRRRFADPSKSAEENAFNGEILQLNGTSFGWNVKNLGFNSKSILFELPPITGARGLIHPIFANRN